MAEFILHSISWPLQYQMDIVTVIISLDNIIDNRDKHTYLPSYITIDPNQLNMMENMFQA